jgi:ribonucleoside-triphosphate reductase
MGCRTYNGADINAEPGTNPQTKDGRGNICPVTIVMPTLAMKAKLAYDKDVAENGADSIHLTKEARFLSLLDEKIHEARDMLIERYQ